MSWIATAGLLGAVTAAALVNNWRSRDAWTQVASGIGLSLDNRWPAMPRLAGRLRGFQVVARQRGKRIAVEVLDIDPWFTLEKDSPMAQSTQPDIEVGDWGFDEVIRVNGDRDFALGLLDEEARLAAEKVVLNLDGRVADEKIVVHVNEIRSIPHVLEAVLTLAEKLERPSTEELPARLVRNALNDPSKGFRVQAFRQLVQEFSDAPEVQPAARELLGEREDELRLEAAKVLLHRDDDAEIRQQGAEVLARLIMRSDLGVALRGPALESLARSEASEEATSIATGLLQDRGQPFEMRRQALTILAQAQAVDELLAVQTVFDGPELTTFAWALGRCGDVAAQPRLLKLLRHLDEQVRVSAIEALGAVGDVRAVHPLRRAAGEKTLVKSPLARAVEEAVLQIQARVDGSQAGEVSIVGVEPMEGAISTAEDGGDGSEGGEVSLAFEDPSSEESP